MVRLNMYLPVKYMFRTEPAWILIIRKGIQYFLNDEYTIDDALNEQLTLPADSKAKIYG
jgi:hypothetical protein